MGNSPLGEQLYNIFRFIECGTDYEQVCCFSFFLILALTATTAAAQTQRALLIGINTYQPAGTTAQHPAGCIYGRCELGAFQISTER